MQKLIKNNNNNSHWKDKLCPLVVKVLVKFCKRRLQNVRNTSSSYSLKI